MNSTPMPRPGGGSRPGPQSGRPRQLVPGVGRPSREQRALVILRVEQAARRAADAAHPEALREWGAQEEGSFPTRRVVEEEIRAEFLLLAEGLGPLAALTPGDVFPGLYRRRR